MSYFEKLARSSEIREKSLKQEIQCLDLGSWRYRRKGL
jgi:hypothetical protein